MGIIYKKYTKPELLKVLDKDGILFVKTNLRKDCIIKISDVADFIMLESERTDNGSDMKFFMPGICGPVLTTFGCFLDKANSLLRQEIIDRLQMLQTTDERPRNIKIFDTEMFFDMLDNKEINNDIKNYNKLYQKYNKVQKIYNLERKGA